MGIVHYMDDFAMTRVPDLAECARNMSVMQ